MNRSLLLILLLIMTASASISAQKSAPVQLDHIALHVQNLQASIQFYHDIIGLDTIPEPFKDGKHFWFATGPSTALHLIEGTGAKKVYYKNNHICFRVSSVTDFTAKLSAYKMNWEDRDGTKNAITNRVDGVHQIWIQDPDGYWIEINDAK